MKRALALGLVLASLSDLVVASPAVAGDQAALLERAQQAEKAADPERAAALYEDALAAAPGARLARRARARLAWLAERSEGGYAPLAALLRVQNLEPEERSASIAAFEAEVASFPEGRVKREALAIVADTHLARGDAAAAEAAYRRWLASPGLSEAERQLAASGEALARARQGRVDESIDALEAQGLGGRAEAVYLRAERAARAIGWIAGALVAAFVALGLASGGAAGVSSRGLRSAFSPARLAAAAFVLVPPLALVWLHDHRLVKQASEVVLACAAGLVLAALFGAGASLRGVSPARGRALAALAALATVSAAAAALAHSRLLFDIMMAWEEAP
jgi:hypothetical protein